MPKRQFLAVVSILCCLLVQAGCDEVPPSSMTTPDPTNSSAGATAGKQAEFLRRVWRLRMGDSYERILSALGAPAREEHVGQDGYKRLTYQAGGGKQDLLVLELDSRGKLTRILSNLPSVNKHAVPLPRVPVEMEPSGRTNFISALQTIQLGDDYQRITNALGTPDYDRSLAKKEGAFVARSLLYYISQSRDQRVDLWLDSSNHLWRIDSNVEGIPDRER